MPQLPQYLPNQHPLIVLSILNPGEFPAHVIFLRTMIQHVSQFYISHLIIHEHESRCVAPTVNAHMPHWKQSDYPAGASYFYCIIGVVAICQADLRICPSYSAWFLFLYINTQTFHRVDDLLLQLGIFV